MMKIKNLLLFAIILMSKQFLFAQADCSSAVIICGNTNTYNPSGVGAELEQLACGGIEHNSTWFAFQAQANGTLNFVIRPMTLAGIPAAVDFDWTLYAIPGAPSSSSCDAKTQLSCNYSGSSTVFGIPGGTGLASPNYTASQFNPGIQVTAGSWYLLMVDQFNNSTPQIFNVQFTGNPEFAGLNSSAGIFNDQPNFTFAPANCSGLFNFTNTSTSVSGASSYLWEFGDGTTSTSQSPSKQYVTAGVYYVRLRVTNANGCSTFITKRVQYNNGAVAMATGGILATPSCTDSNSGTLFVNSIGTTTLGVSGGTEPYTYSLVSPSPVLVAGQSSNYFTGLPAGAYTIRATDYCGSSAVVTINITQTATNTTIGVGLQNSQGACADTPTGSAVIFANGTCPPYTMSLVESSPVTTGSQSTVQRDNVTATYYGTFTNLLPGVYTVEVVDGCGKVRRATFTVNVSTAPTTNIVNSASCSNSPTGTITVTATAANGLSANGSPGTFQYALIAPSPMVRPYQSSSVFENLSPGTYTVAVKDACGNIGTGTSTIGVAGNPTLGTSFIVPTCPNGSTGAIEAQLTGAGGGSPYTFQLIAPSTMVSSPQTNNAFSGLPAGSYTIKLTDICGASVTTTSTVTAASAPSFTTTLVSSCSNSANGTITVVPGATSIGPFSFQLISPGAAIRPAQGSNVANTFNSIFTQLNQGSYTVLMTDACGVPVTNSVTLAAPTALAFPAGSTTVPSCSSSSTGRIVVSIPTTGSAPYTYSIISPSPVVVANQVSRVFDNLPVGSYTVQITDACGTVVSNAAALTIAAATAPTVTVTNTSSCATASGTGTITCSIPTTNQGGGTYNFSLIAPSPLLLPNQVSPIFTGLTAGAYTVQITDQCGVTGTATTTIAAAGAFTPAAGGSVVDCNGSGGYVGQIIVTTPQNYTPGGPIPTGSGGGPYTYAIYDATNTTVIAPSQTSNMFIVPVLTGTPTHTIRVTDACGATSTTTVTINPPAALTSGNITATTLSCASSSTGVVKVSTVASGGLAPIFYSLVNVSSGLVVLGPQTGTTFNNVPASATGYYIRATDACGVSTTSTTPLLFPAAAAPTVTATTQPSCGSISTGKIIASPGTGANAAAGSFSFFLYDSGNTTLISGPTNIGFFGSLAAGTYTVRIVDQCGTVGTVAATVTSTVTALTAAGTATNSCGNGNTGTITGSYTGGSLPVQYALLDGTGATVLVANQSSNIFENVGAGSYIVRVTDACGTIANSTAIAVATSTLTPTITTSTALFCGQDAVIGAFGSGGNGGPFTYSLCSGAGCSTFSNFTTSSTFSISTSGTYRVQTLDRCGNAVTSADIVLTIPTQAVVNSVTPTTTCGASAISVSYSNIFATPYYSIDGGNFSSTLPVSVAVGNHTLLVADYNAGTFSCASNAYSFTISSGTNYYADGDGDGYGAGAATSACTQPVGYVLNNTDCNDSNASVNPTGIEVCGNGIDEDCSGSDLICSVPGCTDVTACNYNSSATLSDGSCTYASAWYVDTDGDGYGAGTATNACAQPTGYVSTNTDCNNNNAAVNPGATEVCNSIDDDCDTQIDEGLTFTNYYADVDGDGYGAGAATNACAQPTGYVTSNTDCNNNNAAVNPGATEVCNSIDDDCDTQIDEGLTFTNYYADVDGDGYGAGAATNACAQPTGYVTSNTDCNNNNSAVNPGATEVCNSIDDDCDTQIDEGVQNNYYADTDGDGYGAGSATAACTAPAGYVTTNTDCNNNNAAVNPGATEVCNSIDDDCDTQIDEGLTFTNYYADVDGDGYGAGAATNACAQPTGYVTSNTDCNNNNSAVNPGATEVCNSIDDDCDTQIDEGVQNNYYADTDGDEYGAGTATSACAAPFGFVTTNTDCNDTNSAVNPGATEVCNSIDDDCDTQIDEGVLNSFYADIDNDGYGAGTASLSCTAPTGFVTTNTDCNDNSSAVNPGASEICNLIDDDCDGTADDGIPVINYYSDLDGDTFGSTLITSTCASLTGNFVVVGGDCDDSNTAINPSAVEICLNSIDDDCDGVVNNGCLPDQLFGESPATAAYAWTTFHPSCVTSTHTLAGFSPSLSAQTVCLTGEDKWHYFTATSEAVSIQVASSANDILLELQNASGTLIATENAVSGLGGEILNYSGLVSGQVYKVGVRNYNSALGIGSYTLCVKMLKRGGCDYGPGPYSLCQYFKATYGGTGTTYTFTFTGISGNAAGNVYTRTQTSDICVLSNVSPSLPYGSTYNVLITSTYTLLDGAGNPEVIAVPGLSPCTMSTVSQPATSLRTADQCVNGTRFRGSVVASLPWVCGVTNWRWEFTEVNPLTYATVGLPIAVNRGAASNYINLGTVAALQNGKTYAVRTAPILPNTGSNYQWGSTYYMCIIGSAGMVVENNGSPTADTKSDIANEANMSLYPNPTHGTDVNINLSGITSENVQIRVVDAMGRQVWINRYTVDGVLNTNITFEQPLANGLYFVEAIFNGEVQTQRLMVQK